MKIEKQIKEEIIESCKKKNLDENGMAKIEGTRKINTLKKIAKELNIELNIYSPRGEYNGYGYKKMPKICEFEPKKVKRFIKKMEIKKAPKIIDEFEREQKWCKKLVELTGITMKEAESIAIEKENYKTDQINNLISRDSYHGASMRRGSLISKIERSNPLRRIRDEEHAQAILKASKRHNETNYEEKLEEARELAMLGEIDRDEVREWARKNAD